MNKFLTKKSDIEAWLNEYQITKYNLIPDDLYGFKVNVDAEVYLSSVELTFIPVKFNKIKGKLDCSFNKLTSLEFCPQIVKSDFKCNDNRLTSLEFCPEIIGLNANCSNNNISSLEFCPQQVSGNFFGCWNNPQLGELSKITDFSVLYQEHLRIKAIKDFNEKLEQSLNHANPRTKVKI